MGKTTSKSISLLTLGLVCALGVLGSIRLANRGFETNAAPTVQTHHRVYVYLADALEYWNDTLYIHYWGGTSTPATVWETRPAMTIVLGDDFYGGMHYFDLPIDVESFMVADALAPADNWRKSDNISVANMFVGSNYLLVKVLEASGGGNDAQMRDIEYIDNHSLSSGQAAAVLSTIDSCSKSYSWGYNAWPQLNDLFITPSTSLIGTTPVLDGDRPDTTIADKCAYLEARYNLDQAS